MAPSMGRTPLRQDLKKANQQPIPKSCLVECALTNGFGFGGTNATLASSVLLNESTSEEEFVDGGLVQV